MEAELSLKDVLESETKTIAGDLYIKVISAYVDDVPYIYGELTSKKNSLFTVTISDVSVNSALDDGQALVLLRSP